MASIGCRGGGGCRGRGDAGGGGAGGGGSLVKRIESGHTLLNANATFLEMLIARFRLLRDFLPLTVPLDHFRSA